MSDTDRDTLMRMAAIEHVRRLSEVYDHLTAEELKPGFVFEGERIPLGNPQRGIFKPRQMKYLLSIKTVSPRPGARVWYDDQRDVHRQIFEGDEMVEYAFMGQNPDAADNRWLREAFETGIPLIGDRPGDTALDGMLQIPEPAAARLLLHRDTEQPELPHPRPQVARKLVARIDLLRPRRNLRLREVLDRRADHVGGLAEPEIEAGHPVGSHCAIYSRHAS